MSFKSNRYAIPVLITSLILTYAFTSIAQAWQPDPYPDYKIFIEPYVQHCNLLQYPQRDGVNYISDTEFYHDGINHVTRDPLKWYENCLSFKIFGTPKLIPILFSLALLPLVYLLTIQITNNKIISLFSFVAFLLNPLYSQWMNQGTYDQSWAFFLILSVYLIIKTKGVLFGSGSFIASLAAKGIGILYLPSLLFTSKDVLHVSWKTTLIIFGIIGTVIFIMLFSNVNFTIGGHLGFYPQHFKDATYGNIGMLLPELVFLVIFAYIGMTWKPKEQSKGKNLCLVWIINSIITTPLIYLFTDQFQFVYRFVPLAVFMSIFIGIIINDLFGYIVETRLKKSITK